MGSGFSIEDQSVIKAAQNYADKHGDIEKNRNNGVVDYNEVSIFKKEIQQAYFDGDMSFQSYKNAMGLYIETPPQQEQAETKPIAAQEQPPELKSPTVKAKAQNSTVNVKPEQPQKTTTTTITLSQETSFGQDTLKLNKLPFEHQTALLDIIVKDLGLCEITYSEYLNLKNTNPNALNKTQYKIIKGNGNISDQWCAHAVSYYSRRAGINIGAHKNTVQAFINWAGSDYKTIKMSQMTNNNYINERKHRAEQIKNQLPNMKEGDFIIWKANNSNNGSYLINVEGGLKSYQSSHIGIIESVDVEQGIVTVIEGNANMPKLNENGERILVKSRNDGENGAQIIGEYQEANRRDGLIRKQYTVEELAAFGYSGYIDNSSRLPR